MQSSISGPADQAVVCIFIEETKFGAQGQHNLGFGRVCMLIEQGLFDGQEKNSF